MHISDGILDPKICAGGYAVAAVCAGYALYRADKNDVAKISVMSAVFFVTSLIHFRIGPGSVHLVLLGPVGIILGPLCPLAFLTGLLFQAVMFGHGGITTLGVNTAAFSVSALLVFAGFKASRIIVKRDSVLSVVSGIFSALGVFAAAAIVLGVIYFSETAFAGIAALFSLSHAILALGEGAVGGIIVHRLLHIKPELLAI
ncbi:MAG: cobalamin biosynthesis protein CbiM [Chitinivibrionales bacterium]|nr:cobalamin biosynthesis protein CbiM [Chitinivibrionales bacterium]